VPGFFVFRKEERMRKVLFSGTRPSGSLTIGNYFGAISQWKQYENEYDCVFCIVDLHGLSVPRSPDDLRQKTLEILCLYVACGLNPQRSTIFIQSQNPHHAELTWILNGLTLYGELLRMTQFKEKSRSSKGISAGLLNYPILMAADILLYQTDLVPVGEDQMQHIELCRSIARRFGREYGEVFRTPEGRIPAQGGRIRSLGDPRRKMDKSDPNLRNIIRLLDSPEEVKSKIMKAKTDSRGDFNIADQDEGIANLVTMMALLLGTTHKAVVNDYEGRGYGALKKDLADAMIAFLEPVQRRFHAIRDDRALITGVAAEGRQRAIERSSRTMVKVREACGLVDVRSEGG
jgi:tryptophanyl-tRNA synthetase